MPLMSVAINTPMAGPYCLPLQELEYSAFRTSLANLEAEFEMREPIAASNGRPVKTAH